MFKSIINQTVTKVELLHGCILVVHLNNSVINICSAYWIMFRDNSIFATCQTNPEISLVHLETLANTSVISVSEIVPDKQYSFVFSNNLSLLVCDQMSDAPLFSVTQGDNQIFYPSLNNSIAISNLNNHLSETKDIPVTRVGRPFGSMFLLDFGTQNAEEKYQATLMIGNCHWDIFQNKHLLSSSTPDDIENTTKIFLDKKIEKIEIKDYESTINFSENISFTTKITNNRDESWNLFIRGNQTITFGPCSLLRLS